MQLFYAPELIPPTHTLNEEESKHCIRVLRLTVGDEVHLTDGRGNLYTARITDDNPRRCSVEITDCQSDFEPMNYRLTMAVAPTKNNDRYEWFLEKATEVGVTRYIPVESAHSERRIFKPERAEKVITSAVKQSLKAYRPQLDPITPFRKLVETPFEGRKLIAHCDAPQSTVGKQYLPDTLRKGDAALILIGPEGDFSPEEIRLALDHGFEEITLGEQRLRTETAALTAVIMTAVINTMKTKEI